MTPLPAPLPDALPTEPLAERIAERLRGLILADAIAPGTPLRERQLAERLGVSRTPLRDALKVLAADGLVRLSPHRGATVAALSPAEIDEKLGVLAALEGFAGEEAAGRASDGEIGDLRALHEDLVAAFRRGDRAEYFRLNQAVHARIVALARNATLSGIYDRLNRQLAFYRWQGSADAALWTTAVAEHERITSLLERRDAAGLAAALRAHVGSTWRQVRAKAAG